MQTDTLKSFRIKGSIIFCVVGKSKAIFQQHFFFVSTQKETHFWYNLVDQRSRSMDNHTRKLLGLTDKHLFFDEDWLIEKEYMSIALIWS